METENKSPVQTHPSRGKKNWARRSGSCVSNPSSEGAETTGQPGLDIEFQARQSYM